MHKQGYARSVLIAGLVIAGLAMANSSLAAPKITTPKQTSGGTHTGTGTKTAGGHKHDELLKALHHAHEKLVHADHDYDGHRAKAAHLVMEAIHKLKPPPAATTGTPASAPKTAQLPKSPAAPGQTPTMSQAESDQHLQQASEILTKVQPHVQEHHAEAGAHLKDAIAEIATALSIK
jgi:hypothetical protein